MSSRKNQKTAQSTKNGKAKDHSYTNHVPTNNSKKSKLDASLKQVQCLEEPIPSKLRNVNPQENTSTQICVRDEKAFSKIKMRGSPVISATIDYPANLQIIPPSFCRKLRRFLLCQKVGTRFQLVIPPSQFNTTV